MADVAIGDQLVGDRLADAAAEYGRGVRFSPTWCSVDAPRLALPAQGWKIHVSARPSTLVATLDAVLPVLLPAACSFKVARSTEVLRGLNSGTDAPTQIGKAITVYTQDVTRSGHTAPKVTAPSKSGGTA